MSKSIEERVVQMEFENESFEKKAAQSTKTLEKLDEKLQFKNGRKSFADVEEAAKKTNFKTFIDAADTVTNKLSNLGIVGVTALTNITNKAVDAGTRLVKSLTIDNVMAGWGKMEQITKSTATLVSQGYDLSEVQRQLERLNWYTDETSYDLTTMVDSISKFTAAGKNLDESSVAMMGIANWAALAGQNASTASRAMYQISQAMQSGIMRKEDYKSIQNASMDMAEFRDKAIQAGIALGTLEEVSDGVYQSLINANGAFTREQMVDHLTEDAWFTSDVMMKVFSDYSKAVDQIYEYTKERGITASQAIEELGDKVDAFSLKGFKAAQEARSLGDAIDATKDAASTAWMHVFQTIFGDYEQQKVLWTDLANSLYDYAVQPISDLQEILQEGLGENVLAANISKAEINFESFRDVLVDVGKEHGIVMTSMIANAEDFKSLLSDNSINAEIFAEAIEKYTEKEKDSIGEDGKKLAALKNLSEAALESGDGFNELGSNIDRISGRELILEGVKNSLLGLIERLSVIKDVWSDIFPAISGKRVYKLAENFNRLSSAFRMTTEEGEKIKSIFSGILRPLKYFIGLSKEFASSFIPVTKLVRYFGNDLISALAFIGDNLSNLFAGNSYVGAFESVRNIINTTTDTVISLANLVKRFSKYISEFIPKVDVLSSISKTVSFLGLNIESGLNNASNSIQSFNKFIDSIGDKDFEKMFSKIGNIADRLGIKFENLKKTISGYGKQVGEFFTPVVRVFRSVVSKISPYIEKSKTNFEAFGSFVKSYIIEPIHNFIEEIINSESPFATFLSGFKKIGSSLRNIGSGFKAFLSQLDFSKWKETSTNAVEAVKKVIKDLVDFVIEKKDELSFSDILAAAAGITSIVAISKVSEAFKKIGDLATSIKTTFSSINSIFKAKQLGNFSNNMKAIASSVLLVSLSLAALTLLPQDKLKQSAIVIGILTTAIVLLSAGLALLAKKVNPETVAVIDAMSKTLIKLALAIDLLSLSVLIIGKSSAISEASWNKTLQTIVLLVSMSGLLVGLTFLLSKISTKLTIGALSIVAIAAAILVLSKAVSKLSQINITNETKDNLENLGSIVLILIGVAALLSQIKITSALGVLGIIGAVEAIILILEQLKTFNINGLKDKGAEVATIVIIIGGLIAALMLLSGLDFDKSLLIMVGSLLAIIGSMFALMVLIEKLGNFEKSTLYKGLEALKVLGLVCGLLIFVLGAASGLSEGNKGFMSIAIALAAVVAVMGLMVVLLKLCEGISLKQVWQPGIILAGIAAILSGLMLAIGKTAQLGGAKGVVYVIGVVAMIITLTLALMTLSSFSFDQLGAPLSALIVVMSVLALVFLAVGYSVSLATSKKTKIGTLIAVIGMLAVVGTSLYFISRNDWRSIAAAGGAMAIAVLAVGGAISIIGKVKPNIKSIAGMAILAAGMGVAITFICDAMLPILQLDTLTLVANIGTLVLALGLLGAGLILGGSIIGAAIPVIGLGIGILVGALLLISATVYVFSAAMTKLDDCNLAKIGNDLLVIAEGLFSVGGASILMVAAGSASLILAVGLVALGGAAYVCAGGLNVFIPAFTSLMSILGAFASSWDSNAGFLTNIKNGLSSLWESIRGGGEAASETAQQVGETMPTRMAVGVQSKEGEVTGSVEQVMTSANQAIESGGEKIANTAEEKAESAMDKISDSVKNGGESLISLISGRISEIPNNLDISQFTGGLESFLGQGYSGVDLSSISSMFAGNMTGALTSGENLSKFSLAGTECSESFVNEFSSYDVTNGVNKFVQNIRKSILDKKNSISDSGKQIAYAGASGFGSIDWYGVGSSAINQVVAGLSSRMSEINSMMASLSAYSGSYFAAGFSSGISSGTRKASMSASDFGKNVYNRFNSSLGIHSPSTLTQESAGYFIDGFILKLDSMKTRIANAVGNSAMNISDAFNRYLSIDDFSEPEKITPVLDMSEVYSKWESAFSDGFYRPVIKPYLDMSDVNYGMMNARAIVSSENRSMSRMNSESNPIQLATVGKDLNSQPSYGDITIQVYGGQNADPNEIAEQVARKFQVMLRRR